MSSHWNVGDQVLCHGKVAVVRFVGEVSFSAGTFVGVEFLKASAGKHDGAVDGVRYFGPTSPERALFVRAEADSLAPYTPEDEAATKLQAQVRRKEAADSVQFAKTFRAYSVMESRGESERLVNNAHSKTASNILDEQFENGEGGGTKPQPPKTPKTPMVAAPSFEALQLEVEPEAPAGGDLTAPRLDFVVDEIGRTSVTRQCLNAVLRHVKRPGAGPLTAGCMARLIKAGMDLLRKEVVSALNEITSPPPPGRVVVLGDTHGQLEDVLWVFFEHGEPSAENVYLFNGDVADRGTGATEIMTLILLFKLWDPRCVHMNRGNHEDPIMNETYGFRDECVDKWGVQKGNDLFTAFNTFFQYLPLASLIDNQVFVVHGGLWRRDFRLAQLRRVPFRRPLPERPGVGTDALLFDSVWSDPHEGKGIGSNARGDAIISFGVDATKRFLKADNLRLVVRSHQVPDSGNGYEWHHGGKCLTVFSASNYCGDCGNLGGALMLTQGEQDQIFEHWAPPLEELQLLEEEADRAQARIRAQARCLTQQKASRRKARERMELDIIRRVQELVVRRKAELFEYWAEADTSPRGVFCIPATLWREGCATILDDTLPWVRLQEVMGVADAVGQVHYVKFLTRYRVAFDASFGLSAAGWERGVWSKLMETLLRADLPLREALAALDATSDGLVSGVEFARLIESCHVRITPMQARALLRSLAVGQGQGAGATNPGQTLGSTQASAGRVSVWDMLGRLTVSLPVASASAAEPEAAAWVVSMLRPLAAAVLDDAWSRVVPAGAPLSEWPVAKVLAAWFEDVDRTHNGYLDEEEFVVALASLAPSLQKGGCPTDADSLRRLARYFDVVGNGRINYFELMNGLTWEDSLGSEFREDMVETLHAAIYFNIAPMRASLRRFDLELNGQVSPEDFVKALRAVSTALTAAGDTDSLGRSQITEIASHLQRTPTGEIDYEGFLRSFRVVDMLMLPTPR